jgi:peptidyl-prolyl cis-trans isomerase D
MLRGIHKASSTWLGKGVLAVIMGFLVISFAIWGIGDIFRGFGQNSAITVAGTEISLEQFREYYTDQLRQLSRRAGRSITTEQVRALGLDRQIIGRLVAETTLDHQAKAMGLGISNAEIAKRITSDPNFRGPNGQFDRARFQELIREAGYSEGRFVETQRKVILRRQIAQSFAGELHIPLAAMTAINQFRNEKRSIEFLALGAAQAGDIPAPTSAELDAYYQEHKVLFRAPEYRKVTLLALSPAALAKPNAVSDADGKNYYEQHKSAFGKPEKREIKQIVFPNAEAAKAAREQIDKGKSFADLAKQRGLKASDTDLGMVTKSAIIDAAIADAAFALKSGAVSQPIKGAFGTVLVTAGKIEPGAQKSYEEVAPLIKKQIAESRAKTQIDDLRDKIEDERAAGSTLAEAGAKLGLKARVIDAVDRSGRAPDGKPIPDLPQQPNLVASAFASDVGVDNDALQLPDGGVLYYAVTGVTPSRERTFDEVKGKVEQQWRDDEIAKRLKAKTDEMVGKLKSGGTLAQLATDAGLQVQKQANLQRGKPAGFLPAKLVEAVFSTPKDVPAVSDGKQATERYVFRVTDVVDPKLDAASAEGKAIATSLANSYSDDITGGYIARLESEFGVDINTSLVNQVIGGARQ